MLDELKFAQGAVSKKDMIPAMSHFCIENRQVRATNGVVTIGSPIACDLNIRPKAVAMVQAISRCDGTVAMNVTPAGKLSIRSQGFKAFVECTADEYDYPRPQGVATPVKGDAFREAMETLRPFIAARGSAHRFAQGVCLSGKSAMATNGKAVAEYWIGSQFPFQVTIPIDAVSEFVRVKESPIHLLIDERSLTAYYEGGKWIRTVLVPEPFPTKAVMELFENEKGTYVELSKEHFEVVSKLKPFLGNEETVIFDMGNVRTHLDTNEGAQVDSTLSEKLIRIKFSDFMALEDIANKIAFNSFDDGPSFFKGSVVRGAIMGMNPHL